MKKKALARSLEEDVSRGGQEHARAAGLAPYDPIGRVTLGPVVIPGRERLVVYDELAVEQKQLFDSGVAMRWIGCSRR